MKSNVKNRSNGMISPDTYKNVLATEHARLLAIWAAVEAGIPESEVQDLPYNEIIKHIAITQRIDAPDVGIVMNGGSKNG